MRRVLRTRIKTRPCCYARDSLAIRHAALNTRTRVSSKTFGLCRVLIALPVILASCTSRSDFAQGSAPLEQMPPPIYAAVEAKTGYSIPSLNHRVIDQQAQTGRACLADRGFVPEDSDFADSKDISGPLEFGNIVGQTIESWALRTETPPPAQTTTSQPSPERVRALQDCREEAVRSVRDPIRPLLEWISSAGQETSAWIGADPRTSKITHVFRCFSFLVKSGGHVS